MSACGPLDFDDEPRPDRAPGAPPPGAPPPGAPPPAKPSGMNRYTWFLGVVGFLLVVLVTLNSVTSEGVNPGGPDAGGRLAPFAAPLADAPERPDEDANVDERKACGVRGPGILNICERAERGPVVLALFPTDAARCRSVLDQFDRIAPRFPRAGFVAVGSRGDRDTLRGRRPYPVAWDKDGAVASGYGLVGCPQISFAERGGKVVLTTRRELSDAELAGRVRELLR